MVEQIARLARGHWQAWVASSLWALGSARATAMTPDSVPAQKVVVAGPALTTSGTSTTILGVNRESFVAGRAQGRPSAAPEQQREAAPPVETEPADANWTRRWSVPIGPASGDADMRFGQIAARGSLVVVASRGTPGQDDDQDGVYVINGAAGIPDDERIVRHIRLRAPEGDAAGENRPPNAAPPAPGSDAIGVALDGDFLVFGISGGVVAKVRLDGAEAWRFSDLPAGTSPGLPMLVDLNRDERRDVVVPVRPTTPCVASAKGCGPEWATLAVALDGRNGRELWRAPRASLESVLGCQDTVMGLEADGALLSSACVSFASGPKSELSEFFGLDGRPHEKPEGLERARDLMPILQGLLSPAEDFYGLELDDSGLEIVRMNEEDRPVAALWSGPLQAPVTVANVDGDGRWDILLLTRGMLQAWSTDASARAAGTLWRTDLAASGSSPIEDTPWECAGRVGPRDGARWLQPARDPTEEADCGPLDPRQLPAAMTKDPLLTNAAPNASEPDVLAEVRCGLLYGINEGQLVVEEDDAWRKVPGAPWPVFALGCKGWSLAIERADGAAWSMPTPIPWGGHTIGIVVAVVGLGLAIAWRISREGKHGGTPIAPQAAIRRTLMVDSPRQRRDEAHPEQKRLLDGLLSVIDNADTRPPISIALYGDWGSGKSSVMQMLRSDLVETGRYIDVWFNAWRFQREKELAPALLQTIVDEVGARTDWLTRLAVLWHRLRRARARQVALTMILLVAVVLLLAVSTRAASASGERMSANGTMGAVFTVLMMFAGGVHRVLLPLFKLFELEPAKLLSSMDSKRRIQFVGAFADEFEQVCKRLPRDTRLIVFIDDLDRCPPDRVVNVLETLSMLADTGSAFFVLAIDPVSVRRAVELTYARQLNIERKESPQLAATFASRYLEKMITLGVNVPKLPAGETHPEHEQSVAPPKESTSVAEVWLWFQEHVLPGAPVTIAILSSVLACLWMSVETSTFNRLLDSGARLLFAPAETPTPKGAKVSLAQNEPAPATVPPASASVERATSPAETPGAAWTLPALRKAERDPPRPEPRRIDEPAAQTPAGGRALSEWLFAGAYALGVLAMTALLLMLVVEARRRKRTGAAPPRVKDADEFLERLKTCRARLSPNPRGVVRFTNLCRFLYPVVAQHAGATSGWQQDFFNGLLRRWSGEPIGTVAAWLAAELDRWIPVVNQSEALHAFGTPQRATPRSTRPPSGAPPVSAPPSRPPSGTPPPTTPLAAMALLPTPLPPPTPHPDSDAVSLDAHEHGNGLDDRPFGT